MWLPLTTFGLIVAGMIGFGFYEKAKYLAAHPDQKNDRAEKKL